MNFNDRLKNNETLLVGSWLLDQNKVVGNNTCKRIDWLINSYLIKISTDKSGWEILYQDPNDKRYWVLTYPNGQLQGGGPPTLMTITQADAQAKFEFD